MKKLGFLLWGVIVGVFIVLNFSSGISADACDTYFPGEKAQCQADHCTMNCFNQNNHWYYHCTPPTQCPADWPIPGGENDPNCPAGADCNAGNHPLSCTLCGNWRNCWKRAQSTPAPSPSPTPFTPGFNCDNNYQCHSLQRPCNPGEQGCYSGMQECTQACHPPPPTETPRPECNQQCNVNNPQCPQVCPICESTGGGQGVCKAPTNTPQPQCNQQCNVNNPQCPQVCPICESTGGGQGVCKAPTNTPVPSHPPSPTPTAGQCIENVTQCSCSGGDAGNCAQCNGGWCNGGVCSTCRNIPSGPHYCQSGADCDAPTAGKQVLTPSPVQCYDAHFPDPNDPNGRVTGYCCKPSGWQRGEPWQITQCLNTSPTPTRVPTATNTPTPTITPTPTGVQPTEEVSSIPTPTLNPARVTPGAVARLAQHWVCLASKPCSNPASGCSVQSDHRAKLSVKDTAKPLANKPTYIFECIQGTTSNSLRCTTGNATTDAAVGATELSGLQSDYGYNFGGMYFSDGSSPAPNPLPESYNNNGNIGTYEWESYTDTNVKHAFMAMNEFDPTSQGGDVGAQQQGTLPFIEGVVTKCVKIQWDPNGIVFDANTLKPVDNATVSLFTKDADGSYHLVNGGDVLGGIENPITTDNSGGYNFVVPQGIYKIEVKKDGYTFPTSAGSVNKNYSSTYTKLYSGGDIDEKGGADNRHDIPLAPKSPSLFDTISSFIQGIFK